MGGIRIPITLAEKKEIERLLSEGCSVGKISYIIGRAYSAVNAEIRFYSKYGKYEAEYAHNQRRKIGRSSRLTAEQNYEIITLYKDGMMPSEISMKTKIPPATVYQKLSDYRKSTGQAPRCHQLPLPGYEEKKETVKKIKQQTSPESRLKSLEDKVSSLEMQIEILTETMKEFKRK